MTTHFHIIYSLKKSFRILRPVRPVQGGRQRGQVRDEAVRGARANREHAKQQGQGRQQVDVYQQDIPGMVRGGGCSEFAVNLSQFWFRFFVGGRCDRRARVRRFQEGQRGPGRARRRRRQAQGHPVPQAHGHPRPDDQHQGEPGEGREDVPAGGGSGVRGNLVRQAGKLEVISIFYIFCKIFDQKNNRSPARRWTSTSASP